MQQKQAFHLCSTVRGGCLADCSTVVPVFDSSKHLRGTEKFKPEDVLTQRWDVDPIWRGEIPTGAFVAVHSTVSTYNDKRTGGDAISFNLCAIQVLAPPTDGKQAA